MDWKAKIKIVCLSLLILLIIGGMITLFQKLIKNKAVFETNIYTNIPSNVSSILQINKPKDIDYYIKYFDSFENIVKAINTEINYPFLILQAENKQYIAAKATQDQEKKIKALLSKKIFPSFSPKEKTYHNTTFLFYPVDDNNFFICTFQDGLFLGGYNFDFLLEYAKKRNFKEHSNLYQPLEKQLKTQYSSNLILRTPPSSYTVFNIDKIDDNIKIEGDNSLSDPSLEQLNLPSKDKIDIDYSIFPNTTAAFELDYGYPSIHKQFRTSFHIPQYTFFDRSGAPLSAIKCKVSKFGIYKKLNKLELSYINQRFDINDFHYRNRIYTTSQKMGKEIFEVDGKMYITFYKDYMFFSPNKKTMINYLKENGNYTNKKSLQLNKTNDPILNIYFSNNLKKVHPTYFNPDNPISLHNKKEAFFITTRKNNKKKIQIYFKNK